jgi:large subunit ribosomal protein L10
MSYHVIKNTLMKIASKGTELEKLNDYIDGPTAIAISYGDPVPLAKILSDFVKNQPNLEIKAGLVQGKVISPDEVKSLATMPSRENMLAQLLGAIQMPAALLLGVMISAFQEFLSVLHARIDQLEKQVPEGSN